MQHASSVERQPGKSPENSMHRLHDRSEYESTYASTDLPDTMLQALSTPHMLPVPTSYAPDLAGNSEAAQGMHDSESSAFIHPALISALASSGSKESLNRVSDPLQGGSPVKRSELIRGSAASPQQPLNGAQDLRSVPVRWTSASAATQGVVYAFDGDESLSAGSSYDQAAPSDSQLSRAYVLSQPASRQSSLAASNGTRKAVRARSKDSEREKPARYHDVPNNIQDSDEEDTDGARPDGSIPYDPETNERVFICSYCGKEYNGKHARSIWRRHLNDKHKIPLSQQPRKTRWDNDANRPKDDEERRQRTLESKRRWARKNREAQRAKDREAMAAAGLVPRGTPKREKAAVKSRRESPGNTEISRPLPSVRQSNDYMSSSRSDGPPTNHVDVFGSMPITRALSDSALEPRRYIELQEPEPASTGPQPGSAEAASILLALATSASSSPAPGNVQSDEDFEDPDRESMTKQTRSSQPPRHIPSSGGRKRSMLLDTLQVNTQEQPFYKRTRHMSYDSRVPFAASTLRIEQSSPEVFSRGSHSDSESMTSPVNSNAMLAGPSMLSRRRRAVSAQPAIAGDLSGDDDAMTFPPLLTSPIIEMHRAEKGVSSTPPAFGSHNSMRPPGPSSSSSYSVLNTPHLPMAAPATIGRKLPSFYLAQTGHASIPTPFRGFYHPEAKSSPAGPLGYHHALNRDGGDLFSSPAHPSMSRSLGLCPTDTHHHAYQHALPEGTDPAWLQSSPVVRKHLANKRK
ncbi:uncharacterized protein L969DRAFT_43494 [Mixia osmundae IAM 14324]|uniref:Uncharacterized protein n=1 Tax=Mixia osmundae (strain CBS 9802 / IAM 14324 / JCM 22182 / KY 12970) TaxID=764103 RepID=G7DSR3_MIXOS|nr:uncharacterized protein L969DRAFT_43494 [Mixia osmundae IAM 14324]KEI41803.1 hypothetical protein L969DRAFT_43494 [Mixia osmundae IAM 14324]GAA93621.1 hypothetical protein E5Q_00265 [Mixia osmundae IAM 14324]